MPKLKTKSSAKKRFQVLAVGSSSYKVRGTQANKRHNMRKRSTRQIRDQRGTDVLGLVESKRVAGYMPYGS